MKHLFFVSGEGGPLLIADAAVALEWRGGDDTDYDDLCNELQALGQPDALIVGGEHGNGLVWDMQGAVTADVFHLPDGSVRLVRTWREEEDADNLSLPLATMEGASKRAGYIDVPSGVLAVLWAPESGENIDPSFEGDFHELDDTTLGAGRGLLRIRPGRYECRTDEVTGEDGDAVRVTLTPSAAKGGPAEKPGAESGEGAKGGKRAKSAKGPKDAKSAAGA